MIRFRIQSEGQERQSVAIESEDDFHYFLDSIHNALEQGEFGSRFSTFMGRFVPAQWSVDELEALQRELETIAQAFRDLPPKPFDSHWGSKVAASATKYASLFDVYVDAAGQPLLGRLIDLCRVARQQGRPLHLE